MCPQPLEGLRGGASHQAVDLVALVQEQVREEAAVLAGDAHDQGATRLSHGAAGYIA
jgi:hypothetical protein